MLENCLRKLLALLRQLIHSALCQQFTETVIFPIQFGQTSLIKHLSGIVCQNLHIFIGGDR